MSQEPHERAAALLCPSTPAKPGVQLIGVVDARGRVANVLTPLTIDAAFIELAQAHGPLGQRFRFSAPCAEGRCSHWGEGQCGLVGRLDDAAAAAGPSAASALPPCAIRSSCRWWAQRGRAACAVCPIVLTEPGAGEAAVGA